MRDGVWLRSEVLRVALRVPWDMPVWPVWQLTGWVVDPHYLVRLQTFRQRAAARPSQNDAKKMSRIHEEPLDRL